ncbi:uncharacterized protein EV420DRAFT_1743041 [Desarmillaria tabescens]|uniref:Uncharacterized protein n=1 Tax=Armillaria tabescens TaxID=1929756 RepID=A0AA39NLX0_ARMTA|nr:uncharacterized protein EV420DRAFT_1743041 [Desarmillaria tabescens]KAK0468062.1 hypothetical protein EV420DRAFT_1743041 [Desarmillaria tabescens]
MNRPQQTVFSRLKNLNTLAINTFGSFFSTAANDNEDDETILSDEIWDPASDFQARAYTPTTLTPARECLLKLSRSCSISTRDYDDIPLEDLSRTTFSDDTPPLTPAAEHEHSLEIRLGKQPVREMWEDEDEWYGLEYTLEMSRRASSGSAGENSRSRESWAALQDDSDEVAYKEWQQWRTYLDYRRAIEYDGYSMNMALWYVEERALWNVYHWELDEHGYVSEEVKERLVQCPPDPYYPRRQKNLGWYLKKSRSIGCLRELEPVVL